MTVLRGGSRHGYITVPIHPFGKGLLTTDGIQWCTAVTTSTDDYETVESVTIYLPGKPWIVEQLGYQLTMRTKSSGATEYVKYKWQGSDDGSSFEYLCAEQTQSADASSYAESTLSGTWAPTGNLLLAGTQFTLRGVVKSAGAGGETASAQTKNSSIITLKLRNFGS